MFTIIKKNSLGKLALAMFMAIAITAAYVIPGTAIAAEERIIPDAIGSTHINADPNSTVFDNWRNVLVPGTNQWTNFGLDPAVPVIVAFTPTIVNIDAGFFYLDILDDYGTIISTDLPVDIYTNVDAGFGYLLDNEIAVYPYGETAFRDNTIYRLVYDNNIIDSMAFKTKLPGSGGGGQALVFNLGGFPWNTSYDVPWDTNFVYSFSNNIPEEVYDKVDPEVKIQDNADSIVVLYEGDPLDIGYDYTITFGYADFRWLVGIKPVGSEWEAGEYTVIIAGLDEANVYDLDPLLANNNNPLQNTVIQVFEVY